MKQEVIFDGLGTLENSQNLAHTSEGLNIEIWRGLQVRQNPHLSVRISRLSGSTSCEMAGLVK